jgi:hypothetical protein
LKKSVKGQWSFVPEELTTERERLASAQEEWKVEINVGTAAAKFDVGMASLVVFQGQQQQWGLGMRVGVGDGEWGCSERVSSLE